MGRILGRDRGVGVVLDMLRDGVADAARRICINPGRAVFHPDRPDVRCDAVIDHLDRGDRSRGRIGHDRQDHIGTHVIDRRLPAVDQHLHAAERKRHGAVLQRAGGKIGPVQGDKPAAGNPHGKGRGTRRVGDPGGIQIHSRAAEIGGSQGNVDSQPRGVAVADPNRTSRAHHVVEPQEVIMTSIRGSSVK